MGSGITKYVLTEDNGDDHQYFSQHGAQLVSTKLILPSDSPLMSILQVRLHAFHT